MANQCILCRIGDFGDWRGPFPHPTQLMNARVTPAELDSIAQYIENASLLDPVVEPWYVPALIGDAGNRIEMTLRTDGRFVFPTGLGFYVRHGIRLPSSFLKHVKAANYSPSDSSSNCSRPIIDRSMYWILWSLLHTRWQPVALCHAARMAFWMPLLGILILLSRWFFRDARMK